METTTQPMINGDGTSYECGGDACGYTGDTYCQNCGYEADEK